MSRKVIIDLDDLTPHEADETGLQCVHCDAIIGAQDAGNFCSAGFMKDAINRFQERGGSMAVESNITSIEAVMLVRMAMDLIPDCPNCGGRNCHSWLLGYLKEMKNELFADDGLAAKVAFLIDEQFEGEFRFNEQDMHKELALIVEEHGDSPNREFLFRSVTRPQLRIEMRPLPSIFAIISQIVCDMDEEEKDSDRDPFN